ncbi:MAG: type II toxin-antitoxin system VapC family toxin [Holophagales bacterium]|nr:type II toxin-antitoxin system VapC family toxin [Holophagales bacterium]MYF95173.1 type II toxin-antitoxin system VapC family toxin [Holophagales bacterium]
MTLLLDTCTFLWWCLDDRRLSATVRRSVSEPATNVYLSASSAWEIAVKHGLGRLQLPQEPQLFVPEQRRLHGFESLVFDEASALQVGRLPLLHKDPFDRLLICQAIEHGMTLVTPDRLISQYPVRVLW